LSRLAHYFSYVVFTDEPFNVFSFERAADFWSDLEWQFSMGSPCLVGDLVNVVVVPIASWLRHGG
jgi:hypothetical protein